MLETIDPFERRLLISGAGRSRLFLELADGGIESDAVERGVLGHFLEDLAQLAFGHLHTSPRISQSLLFLGHLAAARRSSPIGTVSSGEPGNIILVDIPHRTGGIDHEDDVLRLDRDAPELGIISASFPLNTGFSGVIFFHRIETVLAVAPTIDAIRRSDRNPGQ